MYPETDIPPVRISQARLDRIRGELPELLEDRRERLVIEYGIAEEQAKQLIQGDYADIFETLVKHGAPPKVVATTFLSTFPELKNEGVDLEKITERILEDVFSSFNRGVFAKEAIPELLSYIAKHGVSVGDAVKSLGLVTISEDEVARIIQEILDEKEELVKERGMGALGALMGIAMSRLRGKADGRMISNLLKRKLKEFNQ
jgi:glutamyl-tRNA(Gln) amidotransferase subunit E